MHFKFVAEPKKPKATPKLAEKQSPFKSVEADAKTILDFMRKRGGSVLTMTLAQLPMSKERLKAAVHHLLRTEEIFNPDDEPVKGGDDVLYHSYASNT